MLWKLTASSLMELLRAGETSAAEITRSVLDRLAEIEPRINAYLTVTGERALEAAAAEDARPQRSALAGVPIAIKDNICTRGVRTSCASRILENYVPPYEATASARLWERGAILLGKTNLDEFAMGSTNENSAFSPVRNPHDVMMVPGGSSGGSAAAVAAGSAPWALGSDTGGSVRLPASYCGIVGLKPTYGRVSRYGLIAFASSLDQIGPLTRSVADAAVLLAAISGHDKRDSTSASRPPWDMADGLTGNIKGLRIGIIREHMGEGVDTSVREKVMAAARVMADLGAEVGECSLPHSQYSVAAYYLIAPAEASSNLARFDGIRYGLRVDEGEGLVPLYTKTRSAGFGPEVQRRIMLGTYALSSGYYEAYYLKGQQIRTLIREDVNRAFADYDLLLGPTAPTVAFPIGERVADPLQLYLMDVMTIPANLAGIPAISIPCGTCGGLPVGLQLQAPVFEESRLLNAAYAYEQARGPVSIPGVSGEGEV